MLTQRQKKSVGRILQYWQTIGRSHLEAALNLADISFHIKILQN
ncbi:hypothetical protein [Leptolyngbya sp. DQ-M1]